MSYTDWVIRRTHTDYQIRMRYTDPKCDTNA